LDRGGGGPQTYKGHNTASDNLDYYPSRQQHSSRVHLVHCVTRFTMSTTASTPQAGTGNANSLQLKKNNSQDNTGTPPRNIQVRVVHAGQRQQYRCRFLAIEAINQGEDLMAKLYQMIEADSGRISRFFTACGDTFLMRHDSIWVVSVSLVSGSKCQLKHSSGLTGLYE
jgi:hypothetical protein